MILVYLMLKIVNKTGAAEKKCSINFSKENTKFWWSLHYSGDESYLDVNKTKICISKAKDNIIWYNFFLGSVSWDFTKDEHDEISLNGTYIIFQLTIIQIKRNIILIFTNVLWSKSI